MAGGSKPTKPSTFWEMVVFFGQPYGFVGQGYHWVFTQAGGSSHWSRSALEVFVFSRCGGCPEDAGDKDFCFFLCSFLTWPIGSVFVFFSLPSLKG